MKKLYYKKIMIIFTILNQIKITLFVINDDIILKFYYISLIHQI